MLRKGSWPVADGGGDDAGLVKHVVEGSERALAALYDRHAPAVFRAALSLNRDRTVAEEVVQETFLVLWNRAEVFDPALGSLPAWLLTIARNRAVDRLRAAARRVPATPLSALAGDEGDEGSTTEWLIESGELLGAGAMAPGPELALAARETRARVGAAIATLEHPERQAILLAYQEGLTQSEIASRLCWPLGTVKTRSRRALRQLRAALAEERVPEPA
jgi:RNA polymerase sigma-70 factor (ECF subfamily)